MPNKITFSSYALVASLLIGAASAREFEDKFGRIIDAELLSHTGVKADTVTIEKAGKELLVKIAAFSEADQSFIREWMSKTPPTIKYAFRVETERKQVKADGEVTQGFGIDHEEKFEIRITNLTRQPVKDLKVAYRAYYSDYPSKLEDLRDLFEARVEALGGGIPKGKDAGLKPRVTFVELSKKIDKELPYNRTATTETKAIPIHSAKNPLNGDRYKDELIGVIVRIYEPGGKMVFEHRDKKTEEFEWKLDDRPLDF